MNDLGWEERELTMLTLGCFTVKGRDRQRKSSIYERVRILNPHQIVHELYNNFKSMMVNVSVYIEFRKEVKCLLIALMPWQRLMVTIRRKEVRSSENSIKVDNWCDWFPVWIDIWLNNPHACDITWCFIFMGKPMYQCARVLDPVVGKQEEKMRSPNFKT